MQQRCGICLFLLAVVLTAVGAAMPAPAVQCPVPGAYPSLASAVNDLACSEIVIGVGTFPEESVLIARDLTVRGAASGTTTVEGQLRIEGEATQVVVEGLTIDATVARVAGCIQEALLVEGAQVSSLDVIARSSAATPGPGTFCHLFSDGFESGDVTAWSP